VSALRRLSKPLAVLVAMVALALVLSACAFFKEGSLSVSQPGGIGAARVHFVLCTEPGEAEKAEPPCNEDKTEGEVQFLLGIAVTPGSSAPSTITATPSGGGAPIVFTRNDEVTAQIAAGTAALHKIAAEEEPPEEIEAWPPPGLEGIGYLSGVVVETKGPTIEWSVDAEFGLPSAADGSPFVGPFKASPALGIRAIGPEASADRPPKCISSEELKPTEAICLPSEEEAQVGTSDLRIAAPPTAPVYVGGQATLPFGLNFGSTAPTAPSFTLSATSNLPGAAVALSSSTFAPPPLDPSTHRSSGSDTVTLTVPSTAKPGIYEVTLTAKAPLGGTATQVAKFEVTKPKLKIGKVKLNKGNGTAKLSVGVPSAGTLTVSGKGIVKAKLSAKGPKTLKVTIKAKGKAKAKLASTGKAKVKAKVAFKPSNGAAVTKTKSITLKKKLAG
jgi:hypothetical protein